MGQFSYFLGIDVSKSKLDLALLDSRGQKIRSLVFKNQSQVIHQRLEGLFEEYQMKSSDLFICMEATGVYCRPIMVVAVNLGLTLGMEPSWKIRSNKYRRGKSDATDAVRIADFAYHYHQEIRIWEPRSDRIEEINVLLKTRDSLINVRKSLEIPQKEALKLEFELEARIRSRYTEEIIKKVNREIKEIEKKIDQIVQSQLEINRKAELITSIPGVGKQTALQLILFTHNFERFESYKQLACYCGIAPFEHQSGSSVRGKTRVSHKANKRLKVALHMAAITSIRFNPQLRAYYARKVVQGKPKMLVINAIRNKLLAIIYAVLKRGTPYREFSESKENSVPLA